MKALFWLNIQILRQNIYNFEIFLSIAGRIRFQHIRFSFNPLIFDNITIEFIFKQETESSFSPIKVMYITKYMMQTFIS